jgi:hypothetical protein
MTEGKVMVCAVAAPAMLATRRKAVVDRIVICFYHEIEIALLGAWSVG